MTTHTPIPYYQSERVTLFHGDCLQIIPHLSGVDAVVTDPPYPMEFDHVWDHLAKVSRLIERGFLVTLCGHYQMARVVDAIRSEGMEWYWPCVVSNRNQPIMHGFKVKVTYKPCPVFRRGDVRPTRYYEDDLAILCRGHDWDEAQQVHKWGQAVLPFRNAVEVFCPTEGTVLDPFCGSGTTGVACVQAGRRFVGIELDEKHCETAARRIQEAEQAFALFEPAKPEQQGEIFQ